MVKRLAQVWLVITSADVTVTAPPQLSLVVTLAGSAAGKQDTDTLPGQVMVGGVWSNTVMVCIHSAKLPQASVAR